MQIEMIEIVKILICEIAILYKVNAKMAVKTTILPINLILLFLIDNINIFNKFLCFILFKKGTKIISSNNNTTKGFIKEI